MLLVRCQQLQERPGMSFLHRKFSVYLRCLGEGRLFLERAVLRRGGGDLFLVAGYLSAGYLFFQGADVLREREADLERVGTDLSIEDGGEAVPQGNSFLCGDRAALHTGCGVVLKKVPAKVYIRLRVY